MEVVLIPSVVGEGYDIKLKKDNKTLTIVFARVLDLYMILQDGKKIQRNESKTIDFDIDIHDGEVYTLFDNLYTDIINGNIMGDKPKNIKSIDNDLIYRYNLLVDKNNNINWVSDDGILEEEDMMRMSKNENSYRLSFIRNSKRRSYGFKDPYGINIRFSNSGSRYSPFNIVFMRMYQQFYKTDFKKETQKRLINK